jgi:hypothetical protein
MNNKNNIKNNKNNNYILINNLLLNDINFTENNKNINTDRCYPQNKNTNINFNNYKTKSTRNNTDIKNNLHNRKITYSSYDLNNSDKANKNMNKVNINENDNRKTDKTLYKKVNEKSKYSHFFYDSNRNILKNNSPEENHFKTITFLQKMKSNNYYIK